MNSTAPKQPLGPCVSMRAGGEARLVKLRRADLCEVVANADGAESDQSVRCAAR